MGVVALLQANLLSPIVLAFALGWAASLFDSDLEFPKGLHTVLSIYLLLAIGLRGGAELAHTPAWRPVVGALGLAMGTAALAFAVLRLLGRLSVLNAAATAAHYGSVSIVTFSATLGFLQSFGVSSEPYLPALVALMEFPGILVALFLARLADCSRTPSSSDSEITQVPNGWLAATREIMTGKSILLLLGGFVIGWACGLKGLADVAPLFVAPFKGVLVLFLLQMGLEVGRRRGEIGKRGPFLLLFGIGMPIVHGALGILVGKWAGLSLGGCTAMGVLAASASYIAAPAAVRLALPKAEPSIYLTSAMAVTFPFNLTVGIPLYYAMAQLMVGQRP